MTNGRMYSKDIFIVFIFASVISSCSAIQCYDCNYSAFGGFTSGDPGCADPFNPSGVAGIPSVECAGQCYANLTEVASFSTSSVYRGCSTDAGIDCGLFQGCQSIEGSRVCAYCCDGAGCNSQSFEEADQGTTKCYNCYANLTADGMPADDSSCGKADFDGTGDDVYALPCATGTCLTLKAPSLEGDLPFITRGCAVPVGQIDYCGAPASFEFLGFKINCCNGTLCNTGSPDDQGSMTMSPTMSPTTTMAPTAGSGSSQVIPRLMTGLVTILMALIFST